jgi:hypothetical protein
VRNISRVPLNEDVIFESIKKEMQKAPVEGTTLYEIAEYELKKQDARQEVLLKWLS